MDKKRIKIVFDRSPSVLTDSTPANWRTVSCAVRRVWVKTLKAGQQRFILSVASSLPRNRKRDDDRTQPCGIN